VIESLEADAFAAEAEQNEDLFIQFGRCLVKASERIFGGICSSAECDGFPGWENLLSLANAFQRLKRIFTLRTEADGGDFFHFNGRGFVTLKWASERGGRNDHSQGQESEVFFHGSIFLRMGGNVTTLLV